MRKKIIIGIISVAVLLLVTGGFVLADLTNFLGNIKTPDYARQVITDGVKSTFHDGVIYRYPGKVPLLEISGDYYEMGLQYGVLTRPEMLKAIPMYNNLVQWLADDAGVPFPVVAIIFKLKAKDAARKIPQKYLDEIRGMADGSGVSYDSILAISMFRSIGCSSVLMRGPDGTIIHGKNDDLGFPGGLDENSMAANQIIVRAKATGCNAITQNVLPLSALVSMLGCNDKGMTYSIQYRDIRKNDPDGFPVDWLARMMMEQCSSLDDEYKLLDQYHFIGAHGITLTDRKTGQGIVAESTPTAWAKVEMGGPLQYTCNRMVSPELARQQSAAYNLGNLNSTREEVAATFPQKSEYSVEDAINLLRLQIGPDGSDYSWNGTKTPITRPSGILTVVFDPKMDGFYFSFYQYYSARQDIYHVFNDFSKEPVLFMRSVPVNPMAEAMARIENTLSSNSQKLISMMDLARKYPADANMQFLVGYNAFQLSKMDVFAEYAEKAYVLNHDSAEYKLFAGMAAYQKKDNSSAAKLLEGIGEQDLYPAEEVYRLSVLEKVFAVKDPARASVYSQKRSALLDKADAKEYFINSIQPKLIALDGIKK